MTDWLGTSRWEELEPLLDAAMECPAPERAAFVQRVTPADPELRADLEALVREAERITAPSLLNRTAGEVFASLLRDDTEFVARAFAEELAGRYRIVRQVGAGGMATVYLADDERHDRQVAVKILHPDLTATLGAARFLREIKTTARLQHPHLLPLLDSGEVGGQLFYVMPYVSGESLRARLEKEGMLPLDVALRITHEIASALDHGHRHGVIHRDLKPENVLLHEGRALLADWGIALATSAADGRSEALAGIPLGTPQYMSPEQADGARTVDARSDVYALGCVLYEMLTGVAPFRGATAQEIFAQSRTARPTPPSAIRETVPPRVEAAVLRALARLPADRFESAAAFVAALGDGDGATATRDRRLVGAPPRTSSRPALLFGGLAAALALTLAWVGLRPVPSAPVARALVALPAEQGIASADAPRIALSPDGSALAYVGPGPNGRQLWVKRRDQLTSVALAGTDNAEQPVFSPDGQRLAYYVRGTTSATVMVVPVDGGPAIALATSEGIAPSSVASAGFRAIGLAWGADGHIYMDGEGGWGVRRIRASGGAVERAAVRDSVHGLYWWPDPLPTGTGVLVTLGAWNALPAHYRIGVTDPTTGVARVLVEGTFARYASSGHLLYVTADGALMAAPFDARRAVLTGAAVKLLDGIDVGSLAGSDLAISRSGTLAYVPGVGGAGSTPVWVDRSGKATLVDSTDRPWRAEFAHGVALSPDGSRLAYAVTGDSLVRQIWVRQLPHGPLERVTDARGGTRPSWLTNDRLLFGTRPGRGAMDVWEQRADGSVPASPVVALGLTIQEFSTAPGTPWMALRVMDREGRSDLFAIRPGRDRAAVPLLVTPSEERVPTLSRDGRFLAYVSNETGRHEVYVRPFPRVHDGKWQVSLKGGSAPLWSRDGTELFYWSEGLLKSAAVRTVPTFAITARRVLFPVGEYSGSPSRAYDQAPDGRFIMFRKGGGPARELVVVENFLTELKATVR